MTARGRTAECLLLVMMLAAWNLFHRLGDIRQPIWDESYYITSTARFELGRVQFASHPPLGLMLIAAGDHLSGLNARTDWRPIAAVKSIPGDRMPSGFDYRGIRCASALFGTIGAGLFFLLMLALSGDQWTALTLSACYIFDGVILTQFRAGHLDAFQTVFILCALLAFVGAARRRLGWGDLALGAAIGLAAMVRANGVVFLVLPVVLAAARWSNRQSRSLEVVARGALLATGGFLLALAVTAAAFLAVSRAPPDATTPAGRIDRAAMSNATLRHFVEADGVTPGYAISLAGDYHRFMAHDLAGIGRSDPNGSTPWSWLVGQRPITYRWDKRGKAVAYLVLSPNPLTWLLALAGLASSVGLLFWEVVSRRSHHSSADRVIMIGLLTAWCSLLLADLILSTTRVMYLYHYLPNLCLGLAGAALTSSCLPGGWKNIINSSLPLILLSFALVAPLVLHQYVSPQACQLRETLNLIEHCTNTN